MTAAKLIESKLPKLKDGFTYEITVNVIEYNLEISIIYQKTYLYIYTLERDQFNNAYFEKAGASFDIELNKTKLSDISNKIKGSRYQTLQKNREMFPCDES